jgi:DNA-binding CsgD family transcriptional regulator
MSSAAAPALLGMSAVFVEFHFADIGHGTHLLLLLLLVNAIAFRIGPGPATVALFIGGFGSAIAWVADLGPNDPAVTSFAQLVVYLAVGLVFLGVLSLAIKAPRHAYRAAAAGLSSGGEPLDPLTNRERDVVRCAAAGLTTEQIGARLILSPNTVKTHLCHAYAKLGARNRSDAIREALHRGYLGMSDICPHRGAEPAEVASNG